MLCKRIITTAVLFLIYANILSSHPAITTIHPNYGPLEGGNVVTIHGSHFTNQVIDVRFGANSAKFTIVNDNKILATAPKEVASTVPISVITTARSSHTSEEAFYAYQGNRYAYLISQTSNHITPLNLKTHTTETSFSIGRSLAHMIITPDGKMAYISDTALNEVIPINLLDRTPQAPIPVEKGPTRLAIHPDGKKIYVVNEEAGTITLIDLATHTAKLSIPVGNRPKDIVIPFHGLTAYVSDGINRIIPINLITNAPGKPIPVGLEPTALAIDYDGQMLYVLNKGSNSITPITIATHLPEQPIPLKIPSDSLTITPDGKFIYVIHTNSDCITPIYLPNRTILPSIKVGKKPKEMVITPDEKMAYVVNEGSSEFTPIILATQASQPPIPVEFAPSSIVITPDPAPIASYTYQPAPAGTSTVFDASASVTPVDFLTHYIWEFGDETVETTTSPIISHTYQHPGVYHVTLIVINSAGTSQFTVFNSRTPSHSGGPSSTLKKTIQVLDKIDTPKEAKEKDFPPSITDPSSPLLPPLEFKGKIIKNKIHSFPVHYHRLKWKASPDSRVIGYKLYKNGYFIKKFANKKSMTFDHRGPFKKRTTYSLIAFDKNGQKSVPLTLTLP